MQYTNKSIWNCVQQQTVLCLKWLTSTSGGRCCDAQPILTLISEFCLFNKFIVSPIALLALWLPFIAAVALLMLLLFGFVLCLDSGYLAPPCWKCAQFQSVLIASFLLLAPITALQHNHIALYIALSCFQIFAELLAQSFLSRLPGSVAQCCTVTCCRPIIFRGQ